MKDISGNIYTAIEQDSLPPYVDINKPNNERKGLVVNIANYPEAREYLLILNAGFVDTLQPGEDTLISKGFSKKLKLPPLPLSNIARNIKTKWKLCDLFTTIMGARLPTRS